MRSLIILSAGRVCKNPTKVKKDHYISIVSMLSKAPNEIRMFCLTLPGLEGRQEVNQRAQPLRQSRVPAVA